MAEQLDDAEFWLPAQFLTDDDILMHNENLDKDNLGGGFKTELLPPRFGFPSEFLYDLDSLDSSLSSPVESVVGSTETESSDEDEFLAALTRRLAHSTQKLAVPSLFTKDKTEKNMVLVGSPQSTLSGIGSRSVSSNGSPNGPLQVPSPPASPFCGQDDTWDLIYAAAGQVARLKMSSEVPKCNNSCYGRSLPRTQNHAVVKNPTSGLYSSQSLAYNLPQTNQYAHVRQELVLKAQNTDATVWGRQVKPSWQAQQQIPNRARSFCGYENARCGRPLGLPQSSWPALQVQSQQQRQQPQQQSGSGMRAVFLGGSGAAKRESAGTGVFLPRRYGNPPETRRKSGCSTVLLPVKVVQALNLNLDDIKGPAQPHINPGFASNYDALMARRNAVLTQQRRNYRPDGSLNHEIRLPQEWTY